MSVVRIPLDKSKAIKQFLFSTLLLFVCMLMVIRPEWFVKGTGIGFVKTVGYIGSFILIILSSFAAQKVFNKKPGLKIDNEGITDNSLGVMFAKVLWKDVTQIEHLENNGHHYIKITIKNPQNYIANEPNSVKKKMLTLNYQSLQTPVNIVVNRLKIDVEKLIHLITDSYEKGR